MSYYSRKVKLPFAEVVKRVTYNLQQQGFGIITTIDLHHTLRQKLNIGFRKYKILGACNPQFAYEAVTIDSHVGVILPCNVVVQEHENGDVEVSAINPAENIERVFTDSQLMDLAREAGNRLREAIDNLHREVPETHNEALPN